MSGIIPPLPNTPPWPGAQLNHKDNFTFTFTVWYSVEYVETFSFSIYNENLCCEIKSKKLLPWKISSRREV
jgi:hypothetical protein